MLAARLYGNKDLRVEEMEEPAGPEPHQVLVRPVFCGICGTDVSEYLSGPIYVPETSLPQILGHEFSAEVTAVGSEVKNVRPGDRCAVLPHVFCGTCYFCVRGRQSLCQNLSLTGISWPWGGLAEYAAVPSYQCVPLPDGVSYEQGAILEPLATIVHGVDRVMRSGDTLFIAGAGPMGQLAALVARVGGAAEIYMSEANRVRREQASKLGVTAVFDPAECDVVAEILERTSGLGVDCALDCAGTQPTLDACVGATRPAGIVGVIAIHVGHRTIVPEAWTWKDLTVAGIWSFNFYDAPRILRQIGNGTLPVERVITSRIALADVVRSGLERLADPEGTDVKILIAP